MEVSIRHFAFLKSLLSRCSKKVLLLFGTHSHYDRPISQNYIFTQIAFKFLTLFPKNKWNTNFLLSSYFLKLKLANIKINFKFRICSISRLGFNGISNQFTYTFNSINENTQFTIWNIECFAKFCKCNFFLWIKKVDSTVKYNFG